MIDLKKGSSLLSCWILIHQYCSEGERTRRETAVRVVLGLEEIALRVLEDLCMAK